jgi:CRP-like cAMP-binding protein
MPSQEPNAVHNRLLAALPLGELARLRPKLLQVDLPLKQILAGAETLLEHAYFPERGMVSLVRPMLDGASVEVGVIGREGFVGVTAVFGAAIEFTEKMVQIEGAALSIPVATLRKQLVSSPALNALLLHFSQALLFQAFQTAACNGRHTVQQRLIRWLLMARDRSDGDIVPLSHDFLAMMLGVRRPGITVALGALKKAGLIRYSHGKIAILDHAGLKAACCECYGQVQEAYTRLLS